MDAIELLTQRQSFNQLMEPAPEGVALDNILTAGARAPDHGALTPWRFIVFRDKALCELSEIFLEAAELKGEPEAKREKAQNAPLRAPLVIAVIADVKPSEKIPRIEQVVSAGCAVQAMQMAAVAQGFQGIWRTGGFAYDEHVKKALNMKEEDELVGYLYLGTAKCEPPIKPRKATAFFVEYWAGC